MAQQKTKHRLLVTAIDEEDILTRRWEMMAGDGGTVGVVLENLLDAQQRRTDAEREWITVQTQYLTSLVELQRAMGHLADSHRNRTRSAMRQFDRVHSVEPNDQPGTSAVQP